jgi:cold shock CspA family protein
MRASPVSFLTHPTELLVSGITCRIGRVRGEAYLVEFAKVVENTPSEIERVGASTREAILHRIETQASSIESARRIAIGLAQRLAAAIDNATSFRVSGQVKWWNDTKGFGFIMPDSTADDVFVHHSALVMPGFKTLSENQLVSFDLDCGKFGTAARQVVRLDHPEDLDLLDQLSIADENLALALIDGIIRVIAVAPDGRWHLLDDLDRRHALLYVWSLEASLYRTAVEELEALINDPNVREGDLHDFFERHPDFILTEDYSAAHSKVVLESDDGPLIPDFLLEPATSNPLCDLLELKLPDVRIDVMKPRRTRFSAAVAEACAQLRTYRDFFEETRNRQRFQDQYRLQAFRPRMIVVIGRRGRVDPIELRRIEGDVPGFQIRTYDDILERAKHKLSGFKITNAVKQPNSSTDTRI